jgi:SAM-dependent methyltransferase
MFVRDKYETRTMERLRAHYEIEKRLANRLRTASREERRHLYRSLYNELFQLVPDHSQLTKKRLPEEEKTHIHAQFRFLKYFLEKEKSFLEIGPGDCSLSLHVAKSGRPVFAVDVSDEIIKQINLPNNFKLLLSDGTSIPLPHNSIGVAYSNQLMEHLHPDDAFEQLQNIYRVLMPGGVYICITPNRCNGPHDISKYFDTTATGFHLKEYTCTELSALFRKVGFSRVRAYIGGRGMYMRMPIFVIAFCEFLLNKLSDPLRRRIALSLPVWVLLNVRLVGVK